jgi:DNA-binding transcriptional LysR family regulator
MKRQIDTREEIMPRIELHHLKYFVAVAEELNFARAAERLHISQPPLTRRIQQLEKELGVQLFNRTTRRVQLTDAGLIYLEEARATLAQVKRGVGVAQRANRGEIGQLVVGFEASSAYDILPQSRQLFKKQFPNVELTFVEMRTDDLAQALHEGWISLGFVLPPLHNDALAVETILREPMVVAIPRDHPLSGKNKLALEDLAAEAFVMSSRNNRCGLYDQVISVCRHAGFTPKVVQEANEMQIMLGFIAAGIGVSLLPDHVKRLRKPGIVFRPLTPSSAKVELAIAWRRDDASPILREFLEIVRRCARQ